MSSSERVGLRNPWGGSYGGATRGGGDDEESTTTLAANATVVVRGDYVSVPTGGGVLAGGVGVGVGVGDGANGGDGSDSDRPYYKRPKFIRRSYLGGLPLCHMGSPVRVALVLASVAMLSLGAFIAGVRMGQRGLTHSFSDVKLDGVVVRPDIITPTTRSAQADDGAATADAAADADGDAAAAEGAVEDPDKTIVVGFQGGVYTRRRPIIFFFLTLTHKNTPFFIRPPPPPPPSSPSPPLPPPSRTV